MLPILSQRAFYTTGVSTSIAKSIQEQFIQSTGELSTALVGKLMFTFLQKSRAHDLSYFLINTEMYANVDVQLSFMNDFLKRVYDGGYLQPNQKINTIFHPMDWKCELKLKLKR